MNQNRDRTEITRHKQKEQGWVESLKVYAHKGEEMVEAQEPVQGGRSSFGGNMSRSGSCCLGKCVLWTGLMLCLDGSKCRISPRAALSATGPGQRSMQRLPQHQACRPGQRNAAPLGGSSLFIDLLQCESRLEALLHSQLRRLHARHRTSVHMHSHV